jgi:hypothetical protein
MRGKQFVIGVTLALALLAMRAKAQTAPAATVTVGATEGCKTSVIVCDGIPVTVAGTPIASMALYESWIIFYDANRNVVQSGPLSRHVTGYNDLYQAVQYTISYTVSGDPDGNADTDQVAGGFVMNVTWRKAAGMRWGGWVATVTGGSGAQSVTQD